VERAAETKNKHLEAGSNDGLDKILSHTPLQKTKKNCKGGRGPPQERSQNKK